MVNKRDGDTTVTIEDGAETEIIKLASDMKIMAKGELFL